AEPVVPLVAPDRRLHLVVPPLPGLGGVAVPKAEQRPVLGKRGDGSKTGPVHMRGHVAAPRRQHVVAVAHRLAVHVDDVVQALGEVVRSPGHDPHGDPVLSHSAASSIHPMTPRSPTTARTAKRANSPSAYHPSRAVRSIASVCSRWRYANSTRSDASRHTVIVPCQPIGASPMPKAASRPGAVRAAVAGGGTARQNVTARLGRRRARVSARTGPFPPE